jgi:DNA-binding XRE family transcriptional regulator
MEHQDWKTVTIGNKAMGNQHNVTKSITERQKGNQLSKKLLDDDVVVPEKKYSKDFIQKVKNMRQTFEEINTQEKLARKLQVNKATITQLEMGNGYNGELVNKINQLEKRLLKTKKVVP